MSQSNQKVLSRVVGNFFMLGGGLGLSKNVGHHGWPATKKFKLHWLKCPKIVPI